MRDSFHLQCPTTLLNIQPPTLRDAQQRSIGSQSSTSAATRSTYHCRQQQQQHHCQWNYVDSVAMATAVRFASQQTPTRPMQRGRLHRTRPSSNRSNLANATIQNTSPTLQTRPHRPLLKESTAFPGRPMLAEAVAETSMSTMQYNAIEDPSIKQSPQEPLCKRGHSCFTLVRCCCSSSLLQAVATTVASVASVSFVASLASIVVAVVAAAIVLALAAAAAAAAEIAAALAVAATATRLSVSHSTAIATCSFLSTREPDKLVCAQKICRP